MTAFHLFPIYLLLLAVVGNFFVVDSDPLEHTEAYWNAKSITAKSLFAEPPKPSRNRTTAVSSQKTVAGGIEFFFFENYDGKICIIFKIIIFIF